MSSTPTDLRLLQVERAAGMGFSISNRTARGNKTTLAVFEQILTAEFLNWGQYMSIQIMGAAAEAINHTIVIWVAHPQDKTALIVHHLHSIQSGGFAIHAPMHAKGVIHLRFLNSANELDSDVFIWGAGNAGHFEFLCAPVHGWPKGKADTFTPPCGPGMNEGAASGAATVAGADAVGGDAANNPVGVAAGSDASGGDAAAVAARAKQAKRAEHSNINLRSSGQHSQGDS